MTESMLINLLIALVIMFGISHLTVFALVKYLVSGESIFQRKDMEFRDSRAQVASIGRHQ